MFYNLCLGTKSYCSRIEVAHLKLKSRGGFTYPNDFIFGSLKNILLSAVKIIMFAY